MKTIYFIRHAKSDWQESGASDFERGLSRRGYKDINIIGSYLKLIDIKPDLILASCSLRTQITADGLAEKIEFRGSKSYLQELYLTAPKVLKETLMMQGDEIDAILVVGHNPQISDLVNALIDEHILKIPTLGVVAIDFDIDAWSELEEAIGKIDFFVYPKQFKYYMPKQVRAIL
ncbi:MAG: histidine phosphatase family protein [Campylobacterota bacterium]|nr:histidine phosphatase family protein [Campylobacterota bacterium]